MPTADANLGSMCTLISSCVNAILCTRRAHYAHSNPCFLKHLPWIHARIPSKVEALVWHLPLLSVPLPVFSVYSFSSFHLSYSFPSPPDSCSSFPPFRLFSLLSPPVFESFPLNPLNTFPFLRRHNFFLTDGPLGAWKWAWKREAL